MVKNKMITKISQRQFNEIGKYYKLYPFNKKGELLKIMYKKHHNKETEYFYFS